MHDRDVRTCTALRKSSAREKNFVKQMMKLCSVNCVQGEGKARVKSRDDGWNILNICFCASTKDRRMIYGRPPIQLSFQMSYADVC